MFLSGRPSARAGAELGSSRGRLLPLILQDFVQAHSQLELMGFSGDSGTDSGDRFRA